jgi:hypothetical protein
MGLVALVDGRNALGKLAGQGAGPGAPFAIAGARHEPRRLQQKPVDRKWS